MTKHDAIMILIRERESMRVTKTGYARAKRAMKSLDVPVKEQVLLMTRLSFERFAREDAMYQRHIT